MNDTFFTKPQPQAGHTVTVAVSTTCATVLTATGTSITHSLLLVAGAGIAGAVSGRLSTGRPVREVVRSLLNSPS